MRKLLILATWIVATALVASTSSAAEVSRGEWVQTAAYGPIWIPTGTTPIGDAERPYAYLYTPKYGWTWYVSPSARAVPQVYTSAGWVVLAPKNESGPSALSLFLFGTRMTTTGAHRYR